MQDRSAPLRTRTQSSIGRPSFALHSKLGGLLLAHALTAAAFPALAGAQERVAANSGADSTVVDLSDLRAPLSIERRLRAVKKMEPSDFHTLVRNGETRLGSFTLPAGERLTSHLLVVRGNADIYGNLRGNLVMLDGSARVHRGGSVTGDILVLNGTADNEGEIDGTIRVFGPAAPAQPAAPADRAATPSALEATGQRLAGTVGLFLTLLAIGIGLILFARPRLEVVADTASHSFARSLLVGFVGQILALPTLGIMVVGLIVSVVGILLLPFAVAAYALLIGIGIGGGIVAVAHTMGETYTRRQLAAGTVASPNSYRYIALGLGALAVPCLVGALFGWVPIVGSLLRAAAFLIIWLAVTAGFGAMLLSRAGTRSHFAGWETR